MLLKNVLAISATAAIATGEDVYLYVKSSNSEINGNSLSSLHEGAGINYFFLGTASASALTYDSDMKTIYSSYAGLTQYFTVYEGFTGLTVIGPNAELTFDDNNTLLINGTSDSLYACKNTNDPYRYSEREYGLMHYSADAPSECIALSIVNGDAVSSSSAAPSGSASATTTTAAETTTVSTSCTSTAPAASTYTGAANQYAPAGAFAAFAAAAAAALL